MLIMSRGPPMKFCQGASLEVAVGDGGGGLSKCIYCCYPREQ